MRLARAHWYRLVLAAALVVPAVVCQTLAPAIPEATWEAWSESLYPVFLRWQEPAAAAAGRIAIIEVDQATLDAYGWPVDRQYYVKLLDKLKASGHPWVLSMLHFQALGKARGASTLPTLTVKDRALAKAIKNYARYVGTGIDVQPGAELTAAQEEKLLARVLLSRQKAAELEIPYLPLNMVEDERFVEAQRAFGLGSRFGVEPVIHCMPTVLEDAAHSGAFALPSGLVWAAAFGGEARIATRSGALWPRAGEKAPFGVKRTMSVSYKHCLSSPGWLTRDVLRRRQIKSYSLADVLSTPAPLSFKGKVVVLAQADMRRYRGPGVATGRDDGVVPQHVLAARFLDDMLSDAAVRRDPVGRDTPWTYAPLVAAALLTALSFFATVRILGLLSLGALLALLTYSGIRLHVGAYFIPLPTITALATTTLGLGCIFLYLTYHGVRRHVRLGHKLRERLSQCNTLGEIEAACLACAREEFEEASLSFRDYDRAIYEASSDPRTALALMDRAAERAGPSFGPGSLAKDALTRIGRPPGAGRLAFGKKHLDARLAIEGQKGRLGTMRIAFDYRPHEIAFIGTLVDAMRVEVGLHWSRIKLLAEQKLLDFRFLAERTRGEVMERFLTHALISKFSDTRTVQENLQAVLTPRATRATLFQADIRGYSRISATLAPLEMVKLLQSYYSRVVDAAQLVAQVKLIGDCIFFFIEEDAARPDRSSVDMALELAALLVRETEARNAQRGAEGLPTMHFGIGIHYGEVVAGNLSSDSCIDYTVIGPNVNMVARLEELTKNPEVHTAIGPNGLVMSEEAYAGLRRHKGCFHRPLDLERMDVSVRSFSDVKRLCGFTADDMLSLPSDKPLKSEPPKSLPMAG